MDFPQIIDRANTKGYLECEGLIKGHAKQYVFLWCILTPNRQYLRVQLITALSQAPVSRQVRVDMLGSGSLYPSLQLKVQVSLTFLPPTTKHP